MGTDVCVGYNELGEEIGFEFDPPSKLLFCFLNAVLFKLLVEVVKVFLRINGLDPFLPLAFEPDTILEGDSLCTLAARTFKLVESRVLARTYLRVEVCSQF